MLKFDIMIPSHLRGLFHPTTYLDEKWVLQWGFTNLEHKCTLFNHSLVYTWSKNNAVRILLSEVLSYKIQILQNTMQLYKHNTSSVWFKTSTKDNSIKMFINRYRDWACGFYCVIPTTTCKGANMANNEK